jgi:hypothetical protein
MTLRGFHVVFITASALLSFFVAAWCWQTLPAASAARIGGGVGAVLIGLALVAYEIRFLKKTKGVS